MTGNVELTNEPSVIAKIAGINMWRSNNLQYVKIHEIDYRSVMPTNFKEPGNNYHEENGHVIPALIKSLHKAKIKGLVSLTIWEAVKPKREFLYEEDMAKASIFIMNVDKKNLKKQTEYSIYINVGSGEELTIKKLAKIIKKITNYPAKIKFDINKPDKTYRKLLNSNLIK